MRALTTILLIALGLATGLATGQAAEPIRLWPNIAPGEKGDKGPEHDVTKPGDALVGGKRVTRLTDVSVPSITIYRPPAQSDTGAAVVVCPGGGYQILAMDLEGTEVCDWLNSIGVTGILLKYRVPPCKDVPRYAAPLQDVQRALSMVRFHALDWKLDPRRIGVMGFSAGGDVSALASTRFLQRTYAPVDAADQTSCRPDFALLIYPAYLVKDTGPELRPELTVNSNTPPTFLVQTENDPIHVENSIFYYMALKRAGVPAEMHMFAAGKHGYGLRPSNQAVTSWPTLAERWLRGRGVLDEKDP